MSRTKDFVALGKTTLDKNTKKAINDLLSVLDSKIIYPKTKEGEINETRLLAVVKSRGQVYNSFVRLADKIGLDRSTDTDLKSRVIKGLKTTFDEMNSIIIRDIRKDWTQIFADDDPEATEALQKLMDVATNDISDDYLSVIAKTKEEAVFLNDKILDRIQLLQNPEAMTREKLENMKAVSIAEQYAD